MAFYVDALALLETMDVPFLIGGAFAHSRYTGRDRDTKDLDVMLRREDVDRALATFADAGYHVELPFPHWLGKVHRERQYIDVVFSSGNGHRARGRSLVRARGTCRSARYPCGAVPGQRSCSGPVPLSRSASATTAPRSCTCCTLKPLFWIGLVCSSASATLAGAPQLPGPLSASPTPIDAAMCHDDVMNELIERLRESAARA